MKKGEIKRRKRVMPAPMADQAHVHVQNSAEHGALDPTDHPAPAEPTSQQLEVAASSPRSHLMESPGLDAGGAVEQHLANRFPEIHPPRGPLPADFTQYQSSEVRPGTERNHASSRKRSISATEELSVGTPNNPIINAARQAAVVTAIDPSLTDADITLNRPPSISAAPRPSHIQIVMQGSQNDSNSADNNTHQKAVSIRDLTAAEQDDYRLSDLAHVQRRKEERRRVLEAETQRMREALEAKERELLALNEIESR